MNLDTINNKLASSKTFLVACFALFSALVVLVGLIFYAYQRDTIITGAKNNLSIMSDLKAHQISHWRQERISRAHLMTANLYLLNLIQQYNQQQNADLREKIIQAIEPGIGGDGDHSIFLINENNQLLLHIGAAHRCAERDYAAMIAQAQQAHEPLFGPIYSPSTNAEDSNEPSINRRHLHMDLVTPIYRNNDPEQQPLGAIISVIDPDKFLLPLMQLWPTKATSAESVLVRKMGDKITRLTPLRFISGGTMTAITPPSELETPGDYVTLGKVGLLAGYDYRSERIFAAITKIAKSNWFMISKIDRAEVLRPLAQLGALIAVTIVLIIGGVGMIMWLWWRRQQAISRALHYEQELQNRTIITRFDNLTKNSNDLIVLCNEDGVIIDANKQAIAAYGQPIEELRQKKLRAMCDMGDTECSLMWRQLEQHNETNFASMQFRQDGSTFPVEITASWIKVGERRLLQAIIRDVTERTEAAELLRHQAQHDPLTGLPNRTLITDRLQQAIFKGKRQHSQTALLFLDLDRFKNINDTLGHSAGDKVITTIAQRIHNSLRETDTVARFGGDEFMILVENINNIADIATLALKFIDVIRQPIDLGEQEVYITTSIGISIAPNDSDNTDQLIRFVETAMYRAKDMGRNNYQFYTSNMNAHTSERLALETSLRKALANNEFVVYYQPQIELSSGKIVGSEALVRWQHPQRGLVPPDDFIPIAEETGLITEIGMWILEQACRQNSQWQAAGFPELSIAVNLSARQFLDRNLQRDVWDILQRTNFPAKYLELEITESLSMFDVNSSIAIMDAFTAKGISIAIDDFGTGYSSLSHLHLFPINKLKIDRSFINQLSSDSNDLLVPTIIALAQQLKLKVIAEGVETEQQLNILRKLNCHLIQGYYFSKPLPAHDFTELLQNSIKLTCK
ncbi:MAG: EAL domain-containing protein [Desulfuromonas sp.]|nr:EAL domain-containing protein [Desulfuromonas sp.]